LEEREKFRVCSAAPVARVFVFDQLRNSPIPQKPVKVRAPGPVIFAKVEFIFGNRFERLLPVLPPERIGISLPERGESGLRPTGDSWKTVSFREIVPGYFDFAFQDSIFGGLPGVSRVRRRYSFFDKY
jgi:hypothetical protein